MQYNLAFVLNHLFGQETSSYDGRDNYVNRLKNRHDDAYLSRLEAEPPVDAMPLPEIDAASFRFRDLVKQTGEPQSPFVIRGLLDGTSCRRKWDLDYLAERCGDCEVLVFADAKQVIDERRNGFREPAELEMHPLRDVIQNLKTTGSHYVSNVSSIFDQCPELLAELELAKVLDRLGLPPNKVRLGFNQIFIGAKGAGSSLHCANTSNFFFNVHGRKHWFLMSPIYSRYLRPVIADSGIFAISKVDSFGTQPDNPIRKLPRYEVDLEPGDFLFNPPWWWHAVRNESEYSIAVANRWTNMPLGALTNHSFYSHFLLYHPQKAFHAIMGSLLKGSLNRKFGDQIIRAVSGSTPRHR